jgi:release factor glutamine methyltransferase
MWLSLRPQLRAAVAVVSIVFCLLAGFSQQTLHNEIPPQEIPSKVTTSQPTTSRAVLPGIVRWETVPPLRHDVAIMESVFWEPADTDSLRALIFTTPRIKGSRVLEIGTGSGLVSLCCLQAGAAHVVATDLNPNAVQNVRYNAVNFATPDHLDARLVPRRDPNAWTVIKPDERFDFIISNPPWEDQKPKSVAEFALYDPDFKLLDSLVTGARDRLNPNGRMWLAYGCVSAIRRVEKLAEAEQLNYQQLDERSLDELPEVFLPGMLLELTVPTP